MAKPRKVLRDLKAPYLEALRTVVEAQDKATLLDWGISYAEDVMTPLWSHYFPDDGRPKQALQAARMWMSGDIKLPQARAAILACHAAARSAEKTPAAFGAARAIGHVASTMHSNRHCMGLPLYGALAVGYHQLGVDATWGELEECAAAECSRMLSALRKARET